MTPEEVAVDVTARQQNYSLAIRGRYEMEGSAEPEKSWEHLLIRLKN